MSSRATRCGRPAGSSAPLLFASALSSSAPGVVNDLVGLLLLAGVLVYQKVFGAVTRCRDREDG